MTSALCEKITNIHVISQEIVEMTRDFVALI